MDAPDVFDFFDFPQPSSFSLQYPSGGFLWAKAEPSSVGLRMYKRGDNHLEVYRAQRLLNCHIRGNFGAPWTKTSGSLWSLLPENGMLDVDTEFALSQFQLRWGLQSTGCLCPRTRMLLPPHMRLKGSLLLRKPGRYLRPCSPPTYGQSQSTGSQSRSTTSPNPAVKPPAPNPAPSSGASPKPSGDDDDDKPWTVQLSASAGVGASGPLWTGKSSSGSYVKPETLEVDKKLELDVSVPTPLVIGDGHLKLTLAGEYDEPVDRAHLGKPTVQATFQLQADDAIKFGKWGSLSPFAQVSSQWQKDDNKWKQSTVLKGGRELDVNLAKDLKLAADVNSGAQLSGPGNDANTTAKVVVPFEGNLKLQWAF
jgi:hypothetical protein